MPDTKIWRGDAQGLQQVTTLTPADVEIGDKFKATINRKDIEVTATAATVSNVVSLMVAAWNASTIAEFAEITATAGSTTTAGVTTANTHVILTGPADGKPFTVTTSTTNVGDFGVSVVTNVEGSAAT